MGVLDGPLRSLASTLIQTFVSNTATLVRTSDSTYDPISGESTPPNIQTFSIKTTPPEKYSLSEIDGTTVLKTDLKVYIAAADIAIEPSSRSDTITIASVTYTVYKVTRHYSGDLVCLYELQIRA